MTDTKKQQEAIIDAPISLSCLFIDSSDEDEYDKGTTDEVDKFEQNYEIQTMSLTNQSLKIRQYSFHSHNANRVWPGMSISWLLSSFLI